jgi:hypothetical protein
MTLIKTLLENSRWSHDAIADRLLANGSGDGRIKQQD